MKKGRYEKPRPKRFPWYLIVAAFVVVLILLPLVFNGRNTSNQGNILDNSATGNKNADSIAIPGYEALEFKAERKDQIVCLPNPAQNTCFFQISLFLEDGTLIWKSEMIAPGTNSKPIVLNKELEKGTYPKAVLHYSCFEMDKELTPLNGAEIKVTLRVK